MEIECFMDEQLTYSRGKKKPFIAKSCPYGKEKADSGSCRRGEPISAPAEAPMAERNGIL